MGRDTEHMRNIANIIVAWLHVSDTGLTPAAEYSNESYVDDEARDASRDCLRYALATYWENACANQDLQKAVE